MRVGEVNAQARERGQLPMAGHLLAVGQGEAERRRHRQQAKPSRAVSALASASLISLRLVRSAGVPAGGRLPPPWIGSPPQGRGPPPPRRAFGEDAADPPPPFAVPG